MIIIIAWLGLIINGLTVILDTFFIFASDTINERVKNGFQVVFGVAFTYFFYIYLFR